MSDHDWHQAVGYQAKYEDAPPFAYKDAKRGGRRMRRKKLAHEVSAFPWLTVIFFGSLFAITFII